MEEKTKMNLTLSIDRAFYLLKHFSKIDSKTRAFFIQNKYTNELIDSALCSSGSKFNYKFCNNPFELIKKIDSLTPVKVFKQENGNLISIFSYEKDFIGFDNLISIADLTLNERSKIKYEIRNGFEVGIIISKKRKMTNECVMVINSETHSIVTFFPGIYAPPFPVSIINEDMKIKAEYFWANHLFLINQ